MDEVKEKKKESKREGYIVWIPHQVRNDKGV
jgi:hypothetical protein